jgi:benzylsuccinate CoA-transferase BbsE subunit
MPVQTVEDLYSDAQLRDRGFFVPVEHPELGRSFEYPGAPYQLSETPFALRPSRSRRRADTAECCASGWVSLRSPRTRYLQ